MRIEPEHQLFSVGAGSRVARPRIGARREVRPHHQRGGARRRLAAGELAEEIEDHGWRITPGSGRRERQAHLGAIRRRVVVDDELAVARLGEQAGIDLRGHWGSESRQRRTTHPAIAPNRRLAARTVDGPVVMAPKCTRPRRSAGCESRRAWP